MNYQTVRRLKNVRLLGVNGLKSNLAGWGIYVVTTVMAVCAGLIIMGYRGSIGEDGLLVTGSPLNFPFYLAVMAVGIYLSLAALIAVARERESGTMEVLFYGPVDPVSYIAGKLLEHLLSFAVIVGGYLTVIFILGSIASFGFYTFLLQRIILAGCYAAALIAMGIGAAVLLDSVRTAVLTLSGIWLCLAGLQWGKAFIPEGSGVTILAICTRFSPFFSFDQGLQALADSDRFVYLISLGVLSGWTFLMLGGAVAILARKGVKMR